jgi:hypothetical protein
VIEPALVAVLQNLVVGARNHGGTCAKSWRVRTPGSDTAPSRRAAVQARLPGTHGLGQVHLRRIAQLLGHPLR